MVMHGVYTDRERQEILAGAAAYDRRVGDELRAAGARPADPTDELYRSLENETLEAIRFYTEDVGLLMALRERFREYYEIREMVRHLINLEKHEIEILKREIESERETAAELKRLRRP